VRRLHAAPTAPKADAPDPYRVVVGAGTRRLHGLRTMKASRSPHPALCPNTLVTSRVEDEWLRDEWVRALAQLPSSFLLA
jgi:hypothetical protein